MDSYSENSLFDQPFLLEEPTDACWKALMDNGHLLFEEEKYQQACRFYEVAMHEAQDIFLSAQVGTVYCDLCPASLLVPSAVSLAESHYRQGERSRAIKTLSLAVDRLSTALSDPGAPQTFSEKCAYHLGSALIKLTTLMRSLGASKEMISAELEKSQAAFLIFSKRDAITKH